MTPRLEQLADRVEKASGPDRDLDIEIGCALWPVPRPFNLSQVAIRNCKPVCPEFTASLDAAIALCERVLPIADWHVRKWIENISQPVTYDAWLKIGHDIVGEASGPTPALALLLALLRALHPTQEGEAR